jgi:hypothetical protein
VKISHVEDDVLLDADYDSKKVTNMVGLRNQVRHTKSAAVEGGVFSRCIVLPIGCDVLHEFLVANIVPYKPVAAGSV